MAGEQTREEWLAERRTGIGGSDVHHLDWTGDYGCRRRLWFDKTGVEADYPLLDDHPPLRRGRILEPIAAHELVHEWTASGDRRRLRRVGAREHLELSFFRCNSDREIVNDPRGVGLLSIKVPGERMFRKFQHDGLSDAYIMQLQWELGVTGRTWGAYWIFHADGWRGLYFEVTADPIIIAGMQDSAARFWREVQHGPMPAGVPVGDGRCLRCPWAKRCQGLDLGFGIPVDEQGVALEQDDALATLAADYEAARREAAYAAETQEIVGDALRAAMGDRQRVRAGAHKVYFTWSKPKGEPAVDVKELKLKEPETYRALAARYTRLAKPTRALRVYAPKEE